MYPVLGTLAINVYQPIGVFSQLDFCNKNALTNWRILQPKPPTFLQNLSDFPTIITKADKTPDPDKLVLGPVSKLYASLSREYIAELTWTVMFGLRSLTDHFVVLPICCSK